MSNILRLKEHLQRRPIAPIFANMKDPEKDDEVALKFMCVIDFEVTKINLYERIKGTNLPKLVNGLLGFDSYKSFNYYDYRVNRSFQGKDLKCKFGQCRFFGPYALVLTHMAINHNMHFGLKLCGYCCKTEFREHIVENSFEECYERYLRLEDISEVANEAIDVHEIITDFYDTLKKCSNGLKIRNVRHPHNYAGKGFGTPVQLGDDYDGDIPKATLYQSKLRSKCISLANLNQAFNVTMKAFYGANASNPAVSLTFHSIFIENNIPIRSISFIQYEPKSKESPGFVSETASNEFVMTATPPATVPSTANGSANGSASGSYCNMFNRTHRSSSTVSNSTQCEHGTNTPQPDVSDQFLNFVGNRIQGIQDTCKRRRLENTILLEIIKAENEPADEQ